MFQEMWLEGIATTLVLATNLMILFAYNTLKEYPTLNLGNFGSLVLTCFQVSLH